MIPDDRMYAATHEWARLETGGLVTVGITDFAVAQLGDILFMALPPAGFSATRGAPMGVIESIKTAVDLYSPVTGVVVESNLAILDDCRRLTTDPFGGGWMTRIKVEGGNALAGLMSAEEYRRHIESQAT